MKTVGQALTDRTRREVNTFIYRTKLASRDIPETKRQAIPLVEIKRKPVAIEKTKPLMPEKTKPVFKGSI